MLNLICSGFFIFKKVSPLLFLIISLFWISFFFWNLREIWKNIFFNNFSLNEAKQVVA